MKTVTFNGDGTVSYFSELRQQRVTESVISPEELAASFTEEDRFRASVWHEYIDQAGHLQEQRERLEREHRETVEREAQLDVLREADRLQREADLAAKQQFVLEQAQREFERREVMEEVSRDVVMREKERELERDVIGGGELKKS
jgi:flagellar motility protein MotE (MotC chaperone)